MASFCNMSKSLVWSWKTWQRLNFDALSWNSKFERGTSIVLLSDLKLFLIQSWLKDQQLLSTYLRMALQAISEAPRPARKLYYDEYRIDLNSTHVCEYILNSALLICVLSQHILMCLSTTAVIISPAFWNNSTGRIESRPCASTIFNSFLSK